MSPEGRIVLPAELRRALGLRPGDRVRFELHADVVWVSPARRLAVELWANNTGGDGGNAAAEVRRAREADIADERSGFDPSAIDQDTRSEEEITAHLIRELGLR